VSRTKIKPKRVADFPKSYRDALAYWAALRQLGFSSDDIFFGFGVVDGEPHMMHLQLKTQGRVFTVVVAQLPDQTWERATKTWTRLCKIALAGPSDDINRCYRDHLVGQSLDYFAALAQGIHDKGILVPEVMMRMPHAGQA